MASEPGINPLTCGGDSQQQPQVSSIGRKNAITEAESALRMHLERNLKSRLQANPCKPHCWFYYGLYDFVLREGRFFSPHSLRIDLPQGLAEAPFLNSLTTSIAKRLCYVEGYALAEMFAFPVFHAWNSDREGLAVDTTWSPRGVAYFGVVIPYNLASAAIDSEGRIGSSIDNWRHDWPLLQRSWSKALVENAL